MPSTRLVARDVRKEFGKVVALAGVNLSVEQGQVHALIGENGAGKSTLMNILAGAAAPDGGEILLDGAPYRPTGPFDARQAGVAMVHQELSLCPHLTVEENLLLGVEPSVLGIMRRAEMRERAAAALALVSDSSRDEQLQPGARVVDLSPAAQQLVEVARAVSQVSCRVLILDEPTSSLAADDVKRLFSVIRSLREKGIAIIYISHFLEEAREVADAYTVLRDGKTIETGPMGDAEISHLVETMAGRRVAELFPRSPHTPGDVVIELDRLAGAVKPTSASLTLRRGEVLGVAGLVGAGRTELLRAIFGLDPVKSGEIRVMGISGPESPGARLRQGVGLVSEDRKGEGLATSLSIADNVTLSKLRGLGEAGLVLPSRQRAVAQTWIDQLSIRASGPDQAVGDLSGGNQQKVAIARLLYHEVDVFLLDEPTRGIDVTSKAQIYGLVDKLALAGKAVLLISSYLPELFGVCDRIAVMRRGRLGPAREVQDITEHGVLTEATGS